MTIEAAGEPDRAALRSWPGVAAFVGDEVLVARQAGTLVAALAWRTVAPDEREILYLETAPDRRRQGLARELLHSLLRGWTGSVFLEVRESNQAALALYTQCGFLAVGRRADYYRNPSESAIVLKFCS